MAEPREAEAGWRPIESRPDDDTQIRLKFPDGEECICPARPGRPLNFHERKTLAKMGHWPDHRKWTPTHWRPV